MLLAVVGSLSINRTASEANEIIWRYEQAQGRAVEATSPALMYQAEYAYLVNDVEDVAVPFLWPLGSFWFVVFALCWVVGASALALGKLPGTQVALVAGAGVVWCLLLLVITDLASIMHLLD